MSSGNKGAKQTQMIKAVTNYSENTLETSKRYELIKKRLLHCTTIEPLFNDPLHLDSSSYINSEIDVLKKVHLDGGIKISAWGLYSLGFNLAGPQSAVCIIVGDLVKVLSGWWDKKIRNRR